MKKYLDLIKKYRDVIYIILICICGFIIMGQHNKVGKLDKEIDRQENNRIALVEELSNYKDEIGRINAEKHAYQLSQEELRDSIGLLKKKNSEYLAYINSNMDIKDTIEVETIVVREVEAKIDGGEIKFEKSDTFGKSSRTLSARIPYDVENGKLYTGNAMFALNQNIFIEGWLERDKKSGETFMHLRSDYPNMTFNSGTGIVAENGRAYERSMRKNCGIGLSVGPNASMSYDIMNKRFVPTIGVGVTIGFNYTPKFLQW